MLTLTGSFSGLVCLVIAFRLPIQKRLHPNTHNITATGRRSARDAQDPPFENHFFDIFTRAAYQNKAARKVKGAPSSQKSVNPLEIVFQSENVKHLSILIR
jgi:hypothetical protein